MADLRDMQLLAALSRHKHFARAADECGISQPAFSARIRNMEADYGVPLVKRGNRFLGFTREGDIVLKWALRLLADEEGLKQEISNVRQDLTARLTLGTIPTAIPFAALAPSALAKAHPGVRVEVRSASSTDIAKGLEDFTFDAGVTYLEGDLSGAHKSVPLYEERYVLLAPQSIATGADEISWAEASKLPLCLLTKNMRNRQIVDQAFEKAGVAPDPVAETNALTAALVQVVAGHAATIAPEMLLEGLPLSGDTVKLKLVEPVESRAVGLVTAERLPVPPALDALEAAMRLIAKEVADKGQG